MNMSGQFGISAPATPPTAGSTVAVFDSTKAFNKLGLQANQITRVKIDFAGLDQPSASGGLIGYKSRDKGATWYHCAFAYAGGSATLPATVAADTGSDSNRTPITSRGGLTRSGYRWTQTAYIHPEIISHQAWHWKLN